MSRIARNVAKGVSFTFLKTCLQLVLGITYFAVISRGLGPENVGVYGVLTGIISIASLFLLTGIEPAVVTFVAKYVAKDQPRTARIIFFRAIFLKTMLGLVVAIGLSLFSNSIIMMFSSDVYLAYLLQFASFLVVLQGVSSSFTSLFEALNRFEFSLGVDFINSLLNVFLAIFFVFSGLEVRGVFLALILAQLVSLIVAAMIAYFVLPGGIKGENFRYGRLFRFSVPYSIAGAFYLIYENIGRVLLGVFSSFSSVGIFTFAKNVTNYPNQLGYSIHTGLLPALSELESKGDMVKIRQVYLLSTKFLLFFGVVITSVLIIFARELVFILGGEKFMPAAILVQIMALLNLPRLVGAPMQSLFLSKEKTSIFVWIGGARTIFEVGLYLGLIPLLAELGASLSLAIAWIFVFVLMMVAVRKVANIDTPKRMVAMPFAVLSVSYIAIVIDVYIGWVSGIILKVFLWILVLWLCFRLRLFEKEDVYRLQQFFKGENFFHRFGKWFLRILEVLTYG